MPKRLPHTGVGPSRTASSGPRVTRTFTVRDFVEIVRSGSIPSPGEDYLKAVEEGVAFWNRPEVPEDPWARTT